MGTIMKKPFYLAREYTTRWFTLNIFKFFIVVYFKKEQYLFHKSQNSPMAKKSGFRVGTFGTEVF